MKRLLVAAVFLAACSSYDPEERIDPAVGPSGDEFMPVAKVLVDRCGQIDCHGSKYRNFRLYGYGSERLDPKHTPISPGTTQAEADEDYKSLVALEPQILQQVIREGGADPDRLTFVRKALNHEDHDGGKPINEGDDADLCIRSWLESRVDVARCMHAAPVQFEDHP